MPVLLPSAVFDAGTDPLAGVPSNTTALLLVNALVGIVLPLLVQVLARINASATVKALINLGLSAAAAVLVPLAAGDGNINWVAVGLSFAQIFGLSIITHYGLFKPTGITGDGGAISVAIPGGIGSAPVTSSAPPAADPVPAPASDPAPLPDPPAPTPLASTAVIPSPSTNASSGSGVTITPAASSSGQTDSSTPYVPKH